FLHTTPSSVTSTLSLHDALPICLACLAFQSRFKALRHEPLANILHRLNLTTNRLADSFIRPTRAIRIGLQENLSTPRLLRTPLRSEEHTSELQSRFDLVCRLLLE